LFPIVVVRTGRRSRNTWCETFGGKHLMGSQGSLRGNKRSANQTPHSAKTQRSPNGCSMDPTVTTQGLPFEHNGPFRSKRGLIPLMLSICSVRQCLPGATKDESLNGCIISGRWYALKFCLLGWLAHRLLLFQKTEYPRVSHLLHLHTSGILAGLRWPELW
jgi:hypothetical protein